MKGLHLHTRLLLLILLLSVQPSLAASNNILVVKSSDNHFFKRTIDSLKKHQKRSFNYRIATLEQLKQQPSLGRQIDIIITLGIRAASYVTQTFPDIPTLNSYLTRLQLNAHSPNYNQSTLLLDQPLRRYLLFAQLLSHGNRIGLLRSEQQAFSSRQLHALEQSLDLKINQRLLSVEDNSIKAARELLQSVDALLALPDPKIYNRRTLKGILLTAYRQRKPLISYSPAQVKSGALGAIFSTPEQIGRQLKELLNKILLQPGFSPARLYYPQYFDISINRQVAASLELDVASEQTLHQQLLQSKP